MEARVLPVNEDSIREAAAVILSGGLVAFPTETVYGLGANALNAEAIERVFHVKGRPAHNPLIVHALNENMAKELVARWPEEAGTLAKRFWPGPLTLVLPKARQVPEQVSAGTETVAVRVPSHPVAVALLAACGVPIAAPSANKSSRLSPVLAKHVLKDLGGAIELILDGGRTPCGIESTVLDLVSQPPRILRPGAVTKSDIEAVIGPVELGGQSAELRSPGMLPRHYSPRTALHVIDGDGTRTVELLVKNQRLVGFMPFGSKYVEGAETAPMPTDPRSYSASLYETLHRLDEMGLDVIVVELPPDEEEWMAIRDRLRRAAH